MSEFGFFYGTLMTGFDRRRRLGMDSRMAFRGRGWIQGALFDLGLYPAAVPSEGDRIYGEVFELADPASVLAALDEIEGYRPDEPDTSLYVRRLVPVQFDDGSTVEAWAYFYNAPLGSAPKIPSGDYLEYLGVR
ncbi:MAG TPA: gamma-glutamylcyclotransferase family protein [Vicinamibacterales bacterium]